MRTLYVLVFVIFISACSSSGKKQVDKVYYRFPQTIQSPISKASFKVNRPTAMGILGNRPMVAQNTDGGLTQMLHNFWLDSPKILLQNYLKKLFIYQSEIEPSYILNSQILHFEKKQDIAILTIKFTLVDKTNQVIVAKTYSKESKLTENTVPSFVKNISTSLHALIQEFIQDIP